MDSSELPKELAEHVQAYGKQASLLVMTGYRAIDTSYSNASERRVFARSVLLREALGSTSWDAPPLLTSTQFVEFQEATGLHAINDVLRAIWYIVENICEEPVVTPCIAINRGTGEVYVRLIG